MEELQLTENEKKWRKGRSKKRGKEYIRDKKERKEILKKTKM